MSIICDSAVASAGAVELRNAVTAKFGVELPATVTFDYPTVAALAGFVASRIAADPAPGAQQPAAPTAAAAASLPGFGSGLTEIFGSSNAVAASGDRYLGMLHPFIALPLLNPQSDSHPVPVKTFEGKLVRFLRTFVFISRTCSALNASSTQHSLLSS